MELSELVMQRNPSVTYSAKLSSDPKKKGWV